MRRPLVFLLTGTLLLTLLASAPGPVWADEGILPDDSAFLAAAAQVYGAEASALEVEHKTASTLPDGRPIYWAKVWDVPYDWLL